MNCFAMYEYCKYVLLLGLNLHLIPVLFTVVWAIFMASITKFVRILLARVSKPKREKKKKLFGSGS